MRSRKVIAYLTDQSADDLTKLLDELAVDGWKSQIQIKPLRRTLRESANLLGHRPSTDSVERRISKDWHEESNSRIFVEDKLAPQRKQLEKEGIQYRCCSSATITAELRDELRNRKLDWLSHAEHEWSKSSIGHLPPLAWRDQFAALGYDWVGEILLKQLRVISDAELRNAILIPERECMGFRVAHASVRDGEPG